MIADTPCKVCTDRHTACHSDCDKYKRWKSEIDEWKSTVIQNRNKESKFRDFKISCINKNHH